jgi:transposase
VPTRRASKWPHGRALDDVRAGESRHIASEGGVPVLKKSRWLLLKREENLKTEQRFRLRDMLRYNLKTVCAYLLKEALQQLWDYNSPPWAGKLLDDWCRQVMRSSKDKKARSDVSVWATTAGIASFGNSLNVFMPLASALFAI